MFNSPVINLVILLSFTYFVWSLMLSAINEFIISIFKYRQRNLKNALENLFFDPTWKTFFQDKLINSPHLESLFRKKGKYPAYIPSSNFVYSIIEQIGPENFSADLTNLSASIDKNGSLPDPL